MFSYTCLRFFIAGHLSVSSGASWWDGKDHHLCGDGWVKAGSSCYRVARNENGTFFLSVHEAQRKCRELGEGRGHIASIPNENVEGKIWDYVRYFYNGTQGEARASKSYIYIGLIATGQNREFQWMDGSRADYFNWAEGQPDLTNESCAAARSSDKSWQNEQVAWHDYPCCRTDRPTYSNTVVCEKNLDTKRQLPGLNRLERTLAMKCPNLIRCPNPMKLANARESLSAPRGLGSNLSYECISGYRFPDGESKKILTCTLSGWDPLTPQPCQEFTCDEPPVIRHAYLYKSQYNITYTCQDGYKMPNGNDAMAIRCTTKGWDPSIPNGCRAGRCLPLPHWRDLEVTEGQKYRYTAGDVINYTCGLGAKWENGDSFRVSSCQLNETWHPLLEECTGTSKRRHIALGSHEPTEASFAALLGTVIVIFIISEVVFFLILDFKHIRSAVRRWVSSLDIPMG